MGVAEWGRGFSAAEIAAAALNNLALFSFNGAAAFQPRKPGTTQSSRSSAQ